MTDLDARAWDLLSKEEAERHKLISEPGVLSSTALQIMIGSGWRVFSPTQHHDHFAVLWEALPREKKYMAVDSWLTDPRASSVRTDLGDAADVAIDWQSAPLEEKVRAVVEAAGAS